MFTFFHRKKKIVVDCFTKETLVHQIVPIVKAIKTVPDWWKTLPNVDNRKGIELSREYSLRNMKRCAGFIELYKRGFVLESWGDFVFTVEPQHRFDWNSSSNYSIQHHNKDEFGHAFKNHEHAKLMSPWLLRSRPNHYFMFGPATWSLDKYELTILPGIVEYHLQHSTHVNLMIPIKSETYSFTIPAGNPLIHIIPLNDSYEYEIKNHLVSEQEYDKINSNIHSLYNGYDSITKLYNRNQKREKAKCPFG